MDYKNIAMTARKKIALVAHDNKTQDLFAWAKYNRNLWNDTVFMQPAPPAEFSRKD